MTVDDWLTLATAVGAGIVTGVWFTFSGFVMPALAALSDEQGAAAMRSINRFAVRPPLMVALFGTAALVVVVGIRSGVDDPVRLVGCALYVIGAVVVTAAGNVPLNNALEAAGADAPEVWRRTRRRWVRLNTTRGLVTAASAVLLSASL